MSDHANNAAAVAAGWIRTQTDRGATRSPRYCSEYSKPVVGEPGAAGNNTTATGFSDTSQAAADTVALNALNGARALRYGSGATVNSGTKGGSHVFDVT